MKNCAKMVLSRSLSWIEHVHFSESVKLWPPLGLRHHDISVRHALLKKKLQKIRRQNSYTTEPACFFLSRCIIWKEFNMKCWHSSIPLKQENNCLADGRYKVFFEEFVLIKVCVDSCWAEIVCNTVGCCNELHDFDNGADLADGRGPGVGRRWEESETPSDWNHWSETEQHHWEDWPKKKNKKTTTRDGWTLQSKRKGEKYSPVKHSRNQGSR